MFKSLSPIHKGIILALIGYSGFAISDASAKFLTAHYGSMEIVTYIMFFAVIFLLLFSPLLGGISKPQSHTVKFHGLRAFMNFSISFLVVTAFSLLPLTTIYTIVFAKPFFAVILAMLIFKEIVTKERWIAISVGFIGIMIAMRPGTETFDPALIIPLIIAVCLAIMWVSARKLDGETSFSMAFYPVLGTFFLTLPFTINDAGTLPEVEHVINYIICGAGVALANVCLSLAFRMAPTAAITPFLYFQIVWAVVFGYTLFGDIPDFWTIIGATVIIGSGLYLIFADKEKA